MNALGMQHDSGWSNLSHNHGERPSGLEDEMSIYGTALPYNHMLPPGYGPRGHFPRRGRGFRHRRLMELQRMREAEMARQAAEADYMRGGWGTPGWAMNVAPGYSVPGTMADNPAYYGDDGASAFDAEFDAILAQEDAISSQEDFGALAESRLVPAHYGASPATAPVVQDLGPAEVPQPSTFVESMKTGAGFGVGFLGVMIGVSVLLGGPK